MAHVHHYDTLTDLWHGEIKRQLFARHKIDHVSNSDTIRYDCLFSCDSMAFDFDSGRDLFLMKQRFTVLQNAYIDLDNLERFLDRCEAMNATGVQRRGVVTQLFARQHENAPRKYRWGNCMLGWDFRGGDREPPVLTMHSRVSYIAYIGGLDLALCHVLAREIGARIGREPEEFGFRWFLSSCQFHFFKSLPCLYALDYAAYLDDTTKAARRYPSDQFPTLAGLRKDHSRILRQEREGKTLADEAFAQRRRVRRRWQEHLNGTTYSAPLSELNFDPLRRER